MRLKKVRTVEVLWRCGGWLGIFSKVVLFKCFKSARKMCRVRVVPIQQQRRTLERGMFGGECVSRIGCD